MINISIYLDDAIIGISSSLPDRNLYLWTHRFCASPSSLRTPVPKAVNGTLLVLLGIHWDLSITLVVPSDAKYFHP